MVCDRAFIFHMCVPYDKTFLLVPKFVTLTLKFDSLFKNFNIGHIFWMASDRAFIFHMCVPYEKTFLLVPNFLTLWSWPWSLAHFSKTNIDHIFWMASDRAFIFHICVPYDNTFLLVPKFLTLWSWPWSLAHFSKTLTLAIYFEWQVIRLSYFICVFLMARTSQWYHNFWPWRWSLTHFLKTHFGHIVWMLSDRAFVFHMRVTFDKTFILQP
jgi:hypothetical protein